MATRRKSSTAEAVVPEQSSASAFANRTATQPGEVESGNGKAQSASAQPRPTGPVPIEAMAQHRSAADLEDRIRRRAYEIYEARGLQDGHADEDWLLAEEEITGVTGGG